MPQKFRMALACAATAALTGSLLAAGSAPAGAAPGADRIRADFNGDGYGDLAISAPLAKVSGKSGAGQVAVVYGTAAGLDTTKRTLIDQAAAGIPGTPESGDHFGDRVTTGDLDADGYTDLIVGVHGERIGSTDDFGALTVVWGGASGLGTGTDISSPLPEHRNELGWSVAAGDFDGDGTTDLAAANNASPGLNIFKGPISRTGKAAALTGVDTQDATGINTDKIVAGDVDGDAATDLLVMGQEETSGGGYRTRSVLYRGGTTPKPAGKVAGGYAATIADVDKDGFGDIVTGNFMEKSADEPNGGPGGALTVTYGSATGLSTRTPVRITQDTAGVPGAAEKVDAFGWSLAAGDTQRRRLRRHRGRRGLRVAGLRAEGRFGRRPARRGGRSHRHGCEGVLAGHLGRARHRGDDGLLRRLGGVHGRRRQRPGRAGGGRVRGERRGRCRLAVQERLFRRDRDRFEVGQRTGARRAGGHVVLRRRAAGLTPAVGGRAVVSGRCQTRGSR